MGAMHFIRPLVFWLETLSNVLKSQQHGIPLIHQRIIQTVFFVVIVSACVGTALSHAIGLTR